MEITCERCRKINIWVGALHFTVPWFLCYTRKKYCRNNPRCQMMQFPDTGVRENQNSAPRLYTESAVGPCATWWCSCHSSLPLTCHLKYILFNNSWIRHFIPLAHEDLQLTPTYPEMDSQVPVAGAPSPCQVCRCECHVSMVKLLPGQLSSAGTQQLWCSMAPEYINTARCQRCPHTARDGVSALHPKSKGNSEKMHWVCTWM